MLQELSQQLERQYPRFYQSARDQHQQQNNIEEDKTETEQQATTAGG